MSDPTPEAFFAGTELGLRAYRRVLDLAERAGPVDVAVTRSQVALRRGGRGFAYLWKPGQYLKEPGAEVVLSIGLPREIESPRWKQVAHPSPRIWMHHLEIHAIAELDDEVAAWLEEAAMARRR